MMPPQEIRRSPTCEP